VAAEAEHARERLADGQIVINNQNAGHQLELWH
jgi:hypothetical protein